MSPRPLPALPSLLILAFAGRGAASLKQEKVAQETSVRTVPLYGNLAIEGAYSLDVFVGNPPQRLSAVLDTAAPIGGAGGGAASVALALPCQPCTSCQPGQDHGFRVDLSTSARWQPCDSSCTGECDSDRCSSSWPVGVGGNEVHGHLLRDVVRLGAVDASEEAAAAPTVTLGCLQSAYDPLCAARANGAISLGPRTTTLEQLFGPRSAEQPGSSFFSLCLAEDGGQLTVNGYNDSYPAGKLSWAKLSPTDIGYEVIIKRIGIDGKEMRDVSIKALVDAGDSTYLPSDSYRDLRSDIEAYCSSAESGGCGGALRRGSCWFLPSGVAGLASFPKVAFGLADADGGPAMWEARAYLQRKGLTSMWCYSFDDVGQEGFAVLGASWLMYKEVVFDPWQESLGLASAECPQHKRTTDEASTLNSKPHAFSGGPSLVSDVSPADEGKLAAAAAAPSAVDGHVRQGQDRFRGSGRSVESAAVVEGASDEMMMPDEVEQARQREEAEEIEVVLPTSAPPAGEDLGDIDFGVKVIRLGRVRRGLSFAACIMLGIVVILLRSALGGACCGGLRHRQLRESLIEEMSGQGGGPGSGLRAGGVGGPSPVELAECAGPEEAATEEQE